MAGEARAFASNPGRDDAVVSVDHSACVFDHRRELRSRMMLANACEVLQQNLTDQPHKIIEKVQLLLGDRMTGAERHSPQTFISRKRTDILGLQSKD